MVRLEKKAVGAAHEHSSSKKHNRGSGWAFRLKDAVEMIEKQLGLKKNGGGDRQVFALEKRWWGQWISVWTQKTQWGE